MNCARTYLPYPPTLSTYHHLLYPFTPTQSTYPTVFVMRSQPYPSKRSPLFRNFQVSPSISAPPPLWISKDPPWAPCYFQANYSKKGSTLVKMYNTHQYPLKFQIFSQKLQTFTDILLTKGWVSNTNREVYIFGVGGSQTPWHFRRFTRKYQEVVSCADDPLLTYSPLQTTYWLSLLSSFMYTQVFKWYRGGSVLKSETYMHFSRGGGLWKNVQNF